tara:strand:- start:1999 stop:2829 length:831 start_codon:yes stop_codon:yes gene_type:complete
LVLIPGTTLLPKGLLAVMYALFLGWLFLGISIVADIFMEAIEEITSQTKITTFVDETSGKTIEMEETVWNATIANLTLMALGSSAPEILLAVIEALQNLGKPAGPLGASTIVGSAAFNLLVISAVAVVAVDEPKKVLDTGVFGVTAIMSIFAYLWLYICLIVRTENVVTSEEAWLTIVFFFILVLMAFAADRINASAMKKSEGKETSLKAAEDKMMKMKKNELRQFARTYATFGGDQAIIEVATQMSTQHTAKISEQDKTAILKLYQDILKVKDVS